MSPTPFPAPAVTNCHVKPLPKAAAQAWHEAHGFRSSVDGLRGENGPDVSRALRRMRHAALGFGEAANFCARVATLGPIGLWIDPPFEKVRTETM